MPSKKVNLPLVAHPIAHKDVKDKELYYIVVTNAQGEKHHINVGEKTYNACMLLKEKSYLKEGEEQ